MSISSIKKLTNQIAHSSLGKFLTLYSSKVVSLFIGLATLSIWTRFFPIETYGTYQLFLSFLELLAVANLSGLDAVATQAGALKQDGNFIAATGIRIGVSALIGILWVGIVLYKNMWEGTLFMAVPIVIVIILNQTYSLSENYLVGKGKIFTISMRDVFSKSVGFIVILFCGILAINKPVQLFFIALLSALAFKGAIMYNAYSGLQRKPVQWNRLKFGLNLSFSEFLAIAVTALQKPLVNEFGTLKDVALFSVALTFYNQIKMAILSVIPVLYPQMTKLDSISEVWKKTKRKILLFSGSFFTLCVILFFILPFLIPLLVSRKYYAAIPYAQWLILFTGINAVPALLRSMLSSQRRMKSIYMYDIGFPLLLIGLIALLLPQFGVWGMVAARGASVFISTCFIIMLVYREIKNEIIKQN